MSHTFWGNQSGRSMGSSAYINPCYLGANHVKQPSGCAVTPKIRSLGATLKYCRRGGVPFGICPLVWLSTPSLLQHRGLMFNCSKTRSCPGSNHLPKRPSGTYGHKILGLWCIQLVQQELFSGRSKCQNYQNRQLRYVP